MKRKKRVLYFFIGMSLSMFFSGCSNTELNSSQNRNSHKPFNPNEYYSQQLEVIKREKYKKRKLVNSSEMELLEALEKRLSFKGYRVLVQANYGSFLSHIDKDIFFQINCKRADFVIMNRFGYPEAVIEYNGEGHYQNNSSLRDDIKELACQSAELPFIRIGFHEKNSNFLEVIEKKVIPLLWGS